jgi:hypothetical protein
LWTADRHLPLPEVLGALKPLSQPELLATTTFQAAVVSRRGEESRVGAMLAALLRNTD